MIYFEVLCWVLLYLILGIVGIVWYTGTQEYQDMDDEERAKFWFG